jgi:hypothetical protein
MAIVARKRSVEKFIAMVAAWFGRTHRPLREETRLKAPEKVIYRAME